MASILNLCSKLESMSQNTAPTETLLEGRFASLPVPSDQQKVKVLRHASEWWVYADGVFLSAAANEKNAVRRALNLAKSSGEKEVGIFDETGKRLRLVVLP